MEAPGLARDVCPGLLDRRPGVLTGLLAWGIHILERGGQLAAIANISYALLSIIGAVLLSLGLAINRRSIKFSSQGFEASGGDGEPGG